MFSPTTHPMAEIKEITNMNTAFHMGEQRAVVHVPDKEEMTIGRSTRADYVSHRGHGSVQLPRVPGEGQERSGRNHFHGHGCLPERNRRG